MRRGLIFGIMGFLISFLSIFFYVGPASREKEIAEPILEDAINGWASLGEVLSFKLEEPVSLNDEIFISILMEELIGDISNQPRITITSDNHKILWDTESKAIGEKYKGWRLSENEKGYNITDSITIVGTPINAGNENVGFVYIKFKNKSSLKDISYAGWENYASVLSFAIREDIPSKNISKISKIIKKTSRRDDLLQLTVLPLDKTILWDKDETLIGKDYVKGWIDKAKVNKNIEEEAYLYMPIDFQERKVGEIHLLISLPTVKRTGKEKALFGIFPLELFKVNKLIYPIMSFVLLFLLGKFIPKGSSVSARGGTGVGLLVRKKSVAQAKIDGFRRDMEKLKDEREKLVSEIAKKQKIRKDLENEIGSLQEAKEFMPEEMAEGTVATEGEEEKLLFDNLFKEESTPDRSREELELTQRIVAKRREEIALSSRVEAKRKEVIELQRQIDEASRKLEKIQ